jgi:hypothetical protein
MSAEDSLRQAVTGLQYQSESDAPWTAFTWPDATGTPTAAEVRRRGGQKPSAPVEEKSVDEFFAPLVQLQAWYGDEEKADAAKYQALFAAIKQLLTDAKVICVGRRKVTVFVVGGAKDGGWAGIRTTAVET